MDSARAGINRRLVIDITESVRKRMARATLPQNAIGCMLWDGAERNGYGAIKIGGRVFGTHCVAFVMNGGVITEGCVIAHKCDVKTCVNPEHLECVSIQKNNTDAHLRRKRTTVCGEMCANAVLTEEIVRTALAMYVPRKFGCRRIAAALGVSSDAIKNVLSGRNWKHVKRVVS